MKQYLVEFARSNLPHGVRNALVAYLLTPYQRLISGAIKMRRNRNRSSRFLEIGPGQERIPGFETVNIVGGLQVDYIANASKRLPFPDETFEVVFASHVLEHVPWFETKATLTEWSRVLKRGGRLEVWVPDGELICNLILDQSNGVKNDSHLDGWTMLNPDSDPFLWANGRLFYGVNDFYPSWHKAIFTAASLKEIFRKVGLIEIHQVAESSYRGGANHGPINLGVFGSKA